jgi:hypothetical protein
LLRIVVVGNMAEPDDQTQTGQQQQQQQQQPPSLAELFARAEKLDAEVRRHLEVLKKMGEQGR